MSEKNSFDRLSDELKAKLRECRTEEELNKVLTDAGLELDQDLLEAVVGGLASAGGPGGTCKTHYCVDICRVDQVKPFCPSNCPTYSPK